VKKSDTALFYGAASSRDQSWKASTALAFEPTWRGRRGRVDEAR